MFSFFKKPPPTLTSLCSFSGDDLPPAFFGTLLPNGLFPSVKLQPNSLLLSRSDNTQKLLKLQSKMSPFSATRLSSLSFSIPSFSNFLKNSLHSGALISFNSGFLRHWWAPTPGTGGCVCVCVSHPFSALIYVTAPDTWFPDPLCPQHWNCSP